MTYFSSMERIVWKIGFQRGQKGEGFVQFQVAHMRSIAFCIEQPAP